MQTNPTPYADVNVMLDLLLSEIQAILDQKLVGLYVFGSLVTGDFDADISDIDLIAATSIALDEKELEQLEKMHTDIAHKEQAWDNRIEIGYISVEELRRYNPHYQQALTSPGEPFHVTEVGPAWIINRYVTREKGIARFGPPAATLIDPISREDLMQVLQEIIEEWREWINNPAVTWRRPYQGYAILTMCRAMYTFKHGEFVSKKQAALWAEKELPEWASLIRNALAWRAAYRDEQVDSAATLPETMRFLRFALNSMPRSENTGRE
jgi:predicted nucleotidyltransferase